MPFALTVCKPVDCNCVSAVLAVRFRLPEALTFMVEAALTLAS